MSNNHIVKIPFMERFREPLLSGKKTMTSRTKRYGKEGDIFTAFGARFRLTDVREEPLGLIASRYYDQEGVSSPEEFERVWGQIHPIKGFNSQQMVWLHTFTKLLDANQVPHFMQTKLDDSTPSR